MGLGIDWKTIVASFIVQLIERIAPALLDIIAGWFETAKDEDIIAMGRAIGTAAKERKTV